MTRQPLSASLRQPVSLGAMFALLVSLNLLAGCKGESLAEVTGKVSYKGEPVKGGTLIFSPIGAGDAKNPTPTPGKPGSAMIQPDGTYKVTTTKPGDGATVGKHRITFTPPPVDLTDEQRSDPNYIAPLPPYMGLAPNVTSVEVKSGKNTIDIDLAPSGK